MTFVTRFLAIAMILTFSWVTPVTAAEVPASCSENYADINEDTFAMTEIVIAIDGQIFTYPLAGSPTETISQAEIEAAFSAAMTSSGFTGYYAITSFQQTPNGLEILWIFEGTDQDIRISVAGNFDNNFNFDECSFDDAVVPVIDMRVFGGAIVCAAAGGFVYAKKKPAKETNFSGVKDCSGV